MLNTHRADRAERISQTKMRTGFVVYRPARRTAGGGWLGILHTTATAFLQLTLPGLGRVELCANWLAQLR